MGEQLGTDFWLEKEWLNMLSRKIQLGAAGGSKSYWISDVYGTSTETVQGLAVTSDNNGNVITVGTMYDGSFDVKGFVIKSDSDGNVLWQKEYSEVEDTYFRGVATDDSGNIYVVGDHIINVGGSGSEGLVLKLSSDGSITWAREFGALDSSGATYGYRIKLLSNGDVIAFLYMNDLVANHVGDDGSRDLIVYSLDNSTGGTNWRYRIGTTEQENYRSFPHGLDVDSNDNIYLGWYWYFSDNTTDYRNTVVKLNSSGTEQWDTTLSATDYLVVCQLQSLSVSANGEVYISHRILDDSNADRLSFGISRFNNSGTWQWSKEWNPSEDTFSSNQFTKGSAFDDSTDTFIVVGYDTDSIGMRNNIVYCGFDTDGSLQYARKISNTSLFNSIAAEQTDLKNGILYITGASRGVYSSNTAALTIAVPKDGSLTGTYGNYVISTDSISVSNSTNIIANTTTYNTSTLGDSEGPAGTSSSNLSFTDNLITIQ